MIKSYKPYVIIILIAFAALIVMSIVDHVFFGGAKPQESMRKLRILGMVVTFAIFLVLGFSAVPVMVKFGTDRMPASVQEKQMSMVYIFWSMYILGLVIALPAMVKDGFFSPDLSGNQAIPRGGVWAIPPMQHQIDNSSAIFLATIQFKDGIAIYRLDEAWKQDAPGKPFKTGGTAVLDISMWELQGYAPQDGRQVVLFFHPGDAKTLQPWEIMPVEEGKIRYGYNVGVDPGCRETYSIEELKTKIQGGGA